jgi:hypothetical protein
MNAWTAGHFRFTSPLRGEGARIGSHIRNAFTASPNT